jgi:hypothetical protein
MGKASGGNTESTSKSTTSVNMGPWAPQQPFVEDVFNKAKALYGYNTDMSATGGGQAYGGPTVAGFNPTQNWGMQYTKNVANAPTYNLDAAKTLNLDTLNGKYLDPKSNPWLTKTFDVAGDAVGRQYMTSTAPQTAGAMAAAGRYGSGSYRNLVKGNEINLGKTLDDLATGIYGGNYQAERGRQMDAVGQVPGLMQASFINPTALTAVGGMQQAQEQAKLDADAAKYYANRDAPTRALNTYLGQIQGNYGQSGTTSTTGTQQTPYYSNPTASILGGGLGLASLFSGGANSAASGIGSAIGGLFGKSDIRAKENIRHIGKTNDGQNLWFFTYKDDPSTPHIGLMAQEVESIHPEAVIEIDGVKHVDYALALKDAA